MSRLVVHLSDLHFGRIDPATLDPLVETVRAMQPDLVAISGDLTQRARRAEFLDARYFLERLPLPRIVVPGNHDVPLHNPYSRFVSRFARFREYIEPETKPSHVDAEIACIGVNTGRSLTWKGGRINADQIESVRQCFCGSPAGALKILIVHHPLELPGGWHPSDRALRAQRALAQWEACGVDLILAGHVHRAFAGVGDSKAVVVQAGTATSTRGRGEPNSFNAIHVDTADFRVLRYTWQPAAGSFAVTDESRFVRNT